MNGPALDAQAEPYAELGPVLPSRFEVHARARRLRDLAQLACELSFDGPGCDLARAMGKLDVMRAELGA